MSEVLLDLATSGCGGGPSQGKHHLFNLTFEEMHIMQMIILVILKKKSFASITERQSDLAQISFHKRCLALSGDTGMSNKEVYGS